MKRVVVIGGTNYDLLAYSRNKIKTGDSNDGFIEYSFGGVGRNIAENLARLDLQPILISVIGMDQIGREIIEEGRQAGIKFSIVDSQKTSVYLAIHDIDKNMAIAVSAMDEMILLTVEQIKKRYQLIAASNLLVLDTNLSNKALIYLFKEFDIPICIDVISTTKANKVIPFYESITILKMNEIEAESLSGIQCDKEENIKKIGEYFIKKGVKQVFITLGAKGAYYYQGRKHSFSKKVSLEIENSTGSGDAFFAGVIYAQLKELPLLTYGMAAAIITVKEKGTCAQNMSTSKLVQTIKEYNL